MSFQFECQSTDLKEDVFFKKLDIWLKMIYDAFFHFLRSKYCGIVKYKGYAKRTYCVLRSIANLIANLPGGTYQRD